MNKRQFLKYSTALAAGTLLPVAGRSVHSFSMPDKQPVLRTLGRTGIRLPVVSSGIVPQTNPALLQRLFDTEIRHYDSAFVYQNGRNDTTLGEMLRKHGRDQFIISTKVKLPYDQQTGQFAPESTPDAFWKQFDASLERLGLDYVDILYMHEPPTTLSLLNESITNCLVQARSQGRARFLGFSAHSNQVSLLDAAVESNLYDVALVGYNFRQDSLVKPAIARAAAAGMGIVAMKVFAGEYLDPERNKPINKQAALKWVLNDPNVHTAILTVRTYDDLATYIPVMYDLKMTPAEEKDLLAAAAEPGMYCLGCQACLTQCPEKLPIPDLMRAYMYTYGYREAANGQELVNSLSLPVNPCKGCNSCGVACTMNFRVEEKIRDMARLRQMPVEYLS